VTDFATQRLNMVESQVRPSDITDRRIIRAMSEVPREVFAPPAMRALAYMDADLLVSPQGSSRRRHLLAPRTLARLIQLAEVDDGDRVLDVAGATGYSAAILAQLSHHVTALEPDADLAAFAKSALASVRADRVRIVQGPIESPPVDAAPFDVILINGRIETTPEPLLGQLGPGGRLVTIVGDADGRGAACRFQKFSTGTSKRVVFDAPAPLLDAFRRAPGFVF
jgi:protein-L-isoaspartate(D-aspartate) O-methyltransferase